MQLTSVYLKNFRCFNELSIQFAGNFVLIKGSNGVGKTSLLEALHYACYLKSFRTFSPRELTRFEATSFFVKIQVRQDDYIRDIQIGYADNQRLVKVDQKTVTTHRDVIEFYRIITMTEDDLFIIRGSPENRRTFIDHTILLSDDSFVPIIRKLRSIVENRLALFKARTIEKDMYRLWTEQLVGVSSQVRDKRLEVLARIQACVNELLEQYCESPFTVALEYRAKEYGPDLERLEIETRRSFFGAQLDDFIITLQGKKSKDFASRGQQKLLVILVKIAQIKILSLAAKSCPPILLVDDFMSDLDALRIEQLLACFLRLGCQIIFTSPIEGSPLTNRLEQLGAQQVFIDTLK